MGGGGRYCRGSGREEVRMHVPTDDAWKRSPHPYLSIIQFLAKCTLEDDPTARVQADKDAHQRYEYELNVAEDIWAGN